MIAAERQHAVVRQQHDRLLGEAARQLAVARRVEVDVGGRLVFEGVGVEQAELLLLASARSTARSTYASSNSPDRMRSASGCR